METIPHLEKRLFDFFTEKLNKNLVESRTMQEAFEKTNEQIGFTAYSSFHSYNVNKKSRKKRKAK